MQPGSAPEFASAVLVASSSAKKTVSLRTAERTIKNRNRSNASSEGLRCHKAVANSAEQREAGCTLRFPPAAASLSPRSIASSSSVTFVILRAFPLTRWRPQQLHRVEILFLFLGAEF